MDFQQTLCYLLIRYLVPTALGSAVILRQNVFSLFYLVLLFVSPILPTPNADNLLKGSNGFYLQVIIVVSSFINSAHVVFQIILAAITDYPNSIDYCTTKGQLYNFFGLHRYNDLSILNILRLVGLDFVVFLTASLVYVYCRHIYNRPTLEEDVATASNGTSGPKAGVPSRKTPRRLTFDSSPSQAESSQQLNGSGVISVGRNVLLDRANKRKQKRDRANRLTYYCVELIFCLLLLTAALFEPSVSSSIYFVYFLFIGTWFGFNQRFTLGYHYFRIFIAIYAAVHFLCLFLYQFLLLKPFLAPGNIIARLFGLVEFTTETCEDARQLEFHSYHFVRFLHPFALIGLYFVSVSLIRAVLISKKYLSSSMHLGKYGALSSLTTPILGANINEKLITQHSNRASSSRWSAFFFNTAYDEKIAVGVEPFSTPTESVDRRYQQSPPPVPTARTPLLQGPHRSYETDGSPINSGNVAFVSKPASISVVQTPFERQRSVAYSKATSSASHGELSLFLKQIVDVVKRGSYVLTLIVMMTWSITYHSWLGLFFLIASCFIWMSPNSRQTCLNCSPFIVFYSLALMIGQYVYSLNLTDEELPITIGLFSVSELGFRKYFQYSYQPLFIKLLYTFVFWITLRQKSEQKNECSQELVEYPAFFPVPSTSAAQTPIRDSFAFSTHSDFVSQNRAKSQAYQSIERFLHGCLIKYWIWVVAAMLMVMSISGQKVVIYRIVYMALFLTFTTILMMSYNFWRKFMYAFWMLVILYSMTVLLAIYTYQFHNFPEYWDKYLGIDTTLQQDLGLIVYDEDPFVLFRELLTPTFFIVITIIQVHFVHKPFLEFSKVESPPGYDANDPQSLSLGSSMNDDNGGARLLKNDRKSWRAPKAHMEDDDVRLEIESDPATSHSIQTVVSASIKNKNTRADSTSGVTTNSPKSSLAEIKEIFEKCIQRCWLYVNSFMEFFWRFSEVHILKLIFLFTVLIAIRDLSAMNVLFVFLTVFLMVFEKFEQMTCLLFAMWAGILILLKMLFQLNFAQRIEWHTNCTDWQNSSTTASGDRIIDNRTYIGFLKVDDIFDYVFNYILLIVILVLRTVINLRQTQNNVTCSMSNGTIFANISRESIDKGFVEFFKFIANFGCYKFGVEVVLIFLTISISKRGDIFTVFYCLWLMMFVLFSRSGTKKAWPYFVGFFGIILPLQYLACLGIPPGLCLSYPWDSVIKIPRSQREWYFLPNFDEPLPKEKLYLDFFILFLACRQLIWFRLENKLESIAGSNVEAHKETPVSTRPNVPDFFSFGTNSFDSAKSIFFLYFFWASMAMLFMAGTLRINLFGLGYVLGSFIFLWNGNEFYLKPVKMIFKSWKTIMAYSCFTMLVKSILEIFVMTMLKSNNCWLVQLLGVTYYNQSVLSRRELALVEGCSYQEAGLMWDAISFAFLLIQKRIFCSNYFAHLVREIRAQNFLASRGAELIHQIQGKEVAEQEQAEREVMEKIRHKMDRIKAAQVKMFADKAKSIKFHKQDDIDYDISAYTAGGPYGDETLSQVSSTPECELSSILPTVYSPTPSFPTTLSPRSAASLAPAYYEIYKVPSLRMIDDSCSGSTMPSFTFNEDTHPRSSTPKGGRNRASTLDEDEGGASDTSSVFAASSTQTQVSARNFSSRLKRRSHSISVKSGGYYMFDDFESDSVDLSQGKERESKIPDPEGNEMRNLAKSKGFTAFCSKLFKGDEMSDASLVSAETANLGESSRESAIISVERSKYDPDKSLPTMTTSMASPGSTANISAISSFPSTSKAVEKEPIDENNENELAVEETITGAPNETVLQKARGWFQFLKTFFESILISLTSSLNSVSRDYRFVAKRLSTEKKCLKKIIEIEEAGDDNRDSISDPVWRKTALSKLSHVTEVTLQELVALPPEEARILWEALKTETAESDYYLKIDSHQPETSSIYILFIRSINYAILSRSEIMCYITIVLNQITTASIISLPLPLVAFLWGSLSVPRPSKNFWVSCITYIEIVVVIKYFFQFQFWTWNETVKLSPLWWPRLFGIERKDNYANWDLVLLLALFFHRFMLKSLGLWDLSETEVQAFMANTELVRSESSSDSDSKTKKRSVKNKKKQQKSKDHKIANYENIPQTMLMGGDDASNETDSRELQLVPHDNDGTGSEDSSSVRRRQTHDYEGDGPEVDEENEQEEEEEEQEFNAIYFLMNLPNRVGIYCKQTWLPVYAFFHGVLNPPYRITRDLYSLMFLCDFINFFILVFGFYAFGTGYSDGNADVSSFLTENRIPAGFLITLLIQFAQIIIDRALYLRKNLVWKLIFQIFSVIFTHIWLFFILPSMTDKAFTDRSNLPPKLWYIFKCIYFLLSASQIRSGYPTRILGNTFCKKYNFVNWYLFKMYMLIPFVYDLRMYMDWIWTDTSLVLDEWSLMEDIFVNLYQRKCELRLDEEFPEPRGKAKKRFFKYLIGGSWVVLIIILIWGPLGLFAFGKAVGETNPPIGATFELEIAGFQSLFKMSVTGDGVREISDSQWSQLDKSYGKNAVAQTFLSGYDQTDVYIVNLNGNSTAVWGISPPSQKILVDELMSNRSMTMKITYSIIRKKRTKTQDMDTTIYDEHTLDLEPIEDKKLRSDLAEMIGHPDKTSAPALIQNIFPNYLRVPEKGKPLNIQELLPRNSGSASNRLSNFRNIQILMKQDSFENFSQSSWWEIHDDCANVTYLDEFMRYLVLQEKCRFLPVVLFNDKVFIGLLAFLSGYGIIGIYTTFVFLVSRFVRGLNSESSYKVIYTRMPNVDRVLQLCLDIYLVRESREFVLEEDLYAKLIFLYRSPETLIKWTKITEEIVVEEAPQTHRSVRRRVRDSRHE